MEGKAERTMKVKEGKQKKTYGKTILPKEMWLPLMLTLVCNTIAYYGSRILNEGRMHWNISNGFDDRIPFLPWTVTIYLGCYLFWIVNYIIGCRQEKEWAFQFLSADLLAKLVCLLIFLIFPTTNVRPAVEGNSLWELVMQWLYRTDAADNLFPSIHCLTSCFCVIAVRKNQNIPVWYKRLSEVLAVSVYVSTLTTKQHVWMDVAAGIALAEGSYWFTGKSGFSTWYAKQIFRINNRWIKERTTDE